MANRVNLERVDPTALGDITTACMAACSNAAAAADRLPAPPTTGPAVGLALRHGSDNRPVDGLWLARSDNGELLGWARLELPIWDNTHIGVVACSVHPSARGRGVGTALLAAQTDAVRSAGRSLLLTFPFQHSAATRFLLENGFDIGQRSTLRRLSPRHLDYERLAALVDDAAAAASDYEVVELDGSAPEDWLPSLRDLFEAINDAPLDDADLEADAFPVERIRGYDTAMTARDQHVYRLFARHRSTGEWAGHTILCVDELRPGVAFQEDTSVLSAHRGHRLGLLLKAQMLLWMRQQHPELEVIDTWNADTNSHMVSVNEQLGCEVAGAGYLLQRHV